MYHSSYISNLLCRAEKILDAKATYKGVIIISASLFRVKRI